MESRSEPGEPTESAPRPGGAAVVVGANWYRFRPGEYLINPHVMSVSFVWVVRGGGTVSSGNKIFRVGPNNIIRLPWHHQVEYQADAQNPFRIGTLHIVPNHAENTPVVPRVAHLADDPLLRENSRTGNPKEFAPSMASYLSGPARRIADLGRFAVERFTDAPFDEESARALAKIVLAENRLWGDWKPNPTLPVAIEEMMAYARSNIAASLSVAEIAHAGDCSATTAQRLFNLHTGVSIRTWIRQLRLQEAAHLLRSSGLRINEIGKLVGFEDPLYFSRVFREEFEVAPSRFALGELRP
jgi:AraC-like DNA-binding protein